MGRSRDEKGGTAAFGCELYNLSDESVMTHAALLDWHKHTDFLEMKAAVSAVQWFKEHYFEKTDLDEGQHLLCMTDCKGAFKRLSSLMAWDRNSSPWFSDFFNLHNDLEDLESSTPTVVFGRVSREDPFINKVDTAGYVLRTANKDEDMDPKVFYDERFASLVALQAKGKNPYLNKLFPVTTSFPQYIQTYNGLGNGVSGNVSVSLAGRIMATRSPSSNLFFYELLWSDVTINVMADAGKSDLTEAEFTEFHTGVKCGDIVGLTGFPAKNHKGKLNFVPKSFTVLSPCLHKMPRQQKAGSAAKAEVWAPGKPRNPEMYVLKDQETRCRKPYLDLLLNGEVRAIFKTRSGVFSYIRRFLDKRDFLEVPPPMMNMIAGGGAARPFSEHYLKELIVGGLNNVYEFGNQFRNEGIDLTHNPELTTCKLFMAFPDCNVLMELTEQMLRGFAGMVKELTGDYVVQYHAHGLDKDPIKIDFAPPFRQIDMIKELEKMTALNIPKDLASEETKQYLMDACEKFNVQFLPSQTTPLLLDKLVGHFLKETCVNPCFIINHPEIMSSLTSGRTKRFELFVNKHAVCNAFTELNDPVVQRDKFAELKVRQSSDDKAMALLEKFCTALEYGLPPTVGWELGIDRMTMLLTDSQNIKEVLFPAMKPQDESLTKAASEEH